MPTEKQWQQDIRERLAEREEATSEELSLVEEALQEHPRSAPLWCLRGALIQLAEDDAGYELDDALRSYQRAAELDPSSPQPWEEMGHFADAYDDDLLSAEGHFRKALSLGAGKSAKEGLDGVLAQLRDG
ncbi:MAG: hypothetical protein GY716_13875 [bacterium]|nr:hypothetical protein [bacterium]